MDEARDKKQIEWNVDDFELVFVEDSPQQENSSDCGVFVLRNAKQLSSKQNNNSLNYNRGEMTDFRILMMKEFLNKRLF